jgi:hypothetical protein
MTNVECRKNDEIRMPKRIQSGSSSFEHSGLFRHSSFVLRHFDVRVFRGLKFQAADVSDASCLPYAKQSDENGKAHGDFGGCDRDDEKNENLCVVIGQPNWTDPESRKGNERQVCRIEHQLQ